LHADERRSIIATSNDAGTVTPYAYGPYGEPNAWGGSRFAYTGQIALPELALYHYKARAYDPASHRFLQTDPIGYQGGENLYRYAFDDPIDLSDPTGLCNAVGVSCNGGPPNGPDTPDKFVVMYNQTENPNGNLATFHYQLENSNGQQLTGFDYYALENLSNLNVNGATVNNVQLQKQTSYGDPLPNGQYIDDVGISQNKGVSLTVTIDQTFTVKYNGNTYDLSGTTQFQHISTEVNGKVSNNVVSLKP
jgi:RHS repeat-associated protein